MVEKFDESALLAINRLVVPGRNSSALPRQRGFLRVPFPQNFRVISSTSYSGGTEFVLGWVDIQGFPVVSYDIFALNFLSSNPKPTLVGSSTQSPGTVRIVASSSVPIIFLIQPVLESGFRMSLEFCPTCTATTIAGAIGVGDLGPGTAGQLITWSPIGEPTTIGPGGIDEFLLGAGTGAVPVFKSANTLSLGRYIISTKTANFTADNNADVYLCDCSGGAITAVLPAASSRKSPFTFKKTDSSSNLLVLDASGAETIDGDLTAVISYQNTSVTIVPVSGGWKII